MIPLWSTTAFRPNFVVYKQSSLLRTTINIHSCHHTTKIIKDKKLPSILKNLAITFCREWNTETLTLSSRRFHCCSLNPNSSALHFASSRSLTQSFNRFCVILCGSQDIALCENTGSFDGDGSDVTNFVIFIYRFQCNCVWRFWNGKSFAATYWPHSRWYIRIA
jgi:hypothetical protein